MWCSQIWLYDRRNYKDNNIHHFENTGRNTNIETLTQKKRELQKCPFHGACYIGTFPSLMSRLSRGLDKLSPGLAEVVYTEHPVGFQNHHQLGESKGKFNAYWTLTGSRQSPTTKPPSVHDEAAVATIPVHPDPYCDQPQACDLPSNAPSTGLQ